MTAIDRIKEAAILEFDDKGPRFTMDDLSRRLGMSKKTVYELVGDKERLFGMLVEDAWASIKRQEAAVAADPGLGPVEKFRRVVGIMPSLGAALDYGKVRELEELYPDVRRRMERHLESDWDVTLGLYDDAVREGSLRRVDGQLLRLVLYSAMERLLDGEYLEASGKGYAEAMDGVLDMLVEGLRS